MVCSLFRKRDGTYRKSACALKLRSHTGHVRVLLADPAVFVALVKLA